jgi:hypothetical protein
MEVSEDDVGDSGRRDAEGRQAVEQMAGGERGMVGAGAGVYQRQATAVTNQKGTKFEGQISLRIEELTVWLPTAGRYEALVRRPIAIDVMDANDLESTQLHPSPDLSVAAL